MQEKDAVLLPHSNLHGSSLSQLQDPAPSRSADTSASGLDALQASRPAGHSRGSSVQLKPVCIFLLSSMRFASSTELKYSQSLPKYPIPKYYQMLRPPQDRHLQACLPIWWVALLQHPHHACIKYECIAAAMTDWRCSSLGAFCAV